MPELKEYKGQDGVYLWKYVPSLPAAAVLSGLFLICTAAITFRMIRSRSWYNIPWIIGGLMEFIGFAARALCTDRTDSLILYTIQTILILLAPAFFAASIYMAMSRLMRKLEAEKLSIISARWLTRLFVGGDILSILVTGAGGSMAADPDADPDLVKWIVLVGLFIQIVFFGLFLVTALIFQIRLSKDPTTLALSGHMPWRRIMTLLHVVSALVMARSIFRVIEYAMGLDTYLFINEWPLYAFDAAPMFACMFLWGVFFPRQLSKNFNLKTLSSGSEIHMQPLNPADEGRQYSSVPQRGYA